MVQNVVDFGAEFQANGFADREPFRSGQIGLDKTRPMQKTALEVSEGARFGYRKGRRIQPAVGQKRIHTRYQIRTPDISRSPAAWSVDDRIAERPGSYLRLKNVSCRVNKYRVGPDDAHVDWQPRTCTDDRSNLPATQQTIGQAVHAVRVALALPDRQIVKRAQIERLPDVKRVVAYIVAVIVGITRRERLV